MVFPCCSAAMSTAFILKNASPLLFSLLMTHTPAHPAEISSHAPRRKEGGGREREREGERGRERGSEGGVAREGYRERGSERGREG